MYNCPCICVLIKIEAPSSTPYPAAPSPTCTSGQYLPDPSDCTRFFFCVNGKPVSQKCANGLEWNTEKDYCDWPFNVHCANNQYLNGKLHLKL